MLTFVAICINLYTFVIVCIPFHTFVNTIRYKSNHPHNIIPEYAGCQYRIYIIRYIIRIYFDLYLSYADILFIIIIRLYVPYNSNHSGLYCRLNQYYSNKRLFPNIPNNIQLSVLIRIILFIYCQACNLKPNTNTIISIYLYCVLFVYILIYIPGYAECQYRIYIIIEYFRYRLLISDVGILCRITYLYRISYRNVPNSLFEYNMSINMISIFPNRLFRNRYPDNYHNAIYESG